MTNTSSGCLLRNCTRVSHSSFVPYPFVLAFTPFAQIADSNDKHTREVAELRQQLESRARLEDERLTEKSDALKRATEELASARDEVRTLQATSSSAITRLEGEMRRACVGSAVFRRAYIAAAMDATHRKIRGKTACSAIDMCVHPDMRIKDKFDFAYYCDICGEKYSGAVHCSVACISCKLQICTKCVELAEYEARRGFME